MREEGALGGDVQCNFLPAVCVCLCVCVCECVCVCVGWWPMLVC